MEKEVGNFNSPEKANKYVGIMEEIGEKRVDANIYEYLEGILPQDLTGKYVLDVGCGDGHWLEYLSQFGANHLYGLDRSPTMLASAQKRKEQDGLANLELVQGDYDRLPFQDGSVDMIISTFSLMYSENLRRVMGEMGRVLRPEGVFYLTTNVFDSEDQQFLHEHHHESVPILIGFTDKVPSENRIQLIEEYRDALLASGFVIIDEKQFSPVGVDISDEYQYKKNISLKKVLFVARKSVDSDSRP